MNDLNQVYVYFDYIHFFNYIYICIIKTNAEILLQPSKEIGLEVNTDTSKSYHEIRICNKVMT
jgi:hypothetical protein